MFGRYTAFSILVALTLLVAVPALAQEAEDLRGTIRAAIMEDTRSSALGAEEIEAMVSALVEEASAQGMTAYDIAWRPRVEEEIVLARCDGLPELFCTLNEALGLDGSDVAIPIGLGVTAGILLFVIGSMLLHRHGHHPLAGDLRSGQQ